jgi:hypothetical protein
LPETTSFIRETTLRSDFAGALKEPAAFAAAIRRKRVMVRAMDRDELHDAIARPAVDLARPWPSAFVEDLVAQAEGRTGALPLVEFALKRLWPNHVGNRLDEARGASRLIGDAGDNQISVLRTRNVVGR